MALLFVEALARAQAQSEGCEIGRNVCDLGSVELRQIGKARFDLTQDGAGVGLGTLAGELAGALPDLPEKSPLRAIRALRIGVIVVVVVEKATFLAAPTAGWRRADLGGSSGRLPRHTRCQGPALG